MCGLDGEYKNKIEKLVKLFEDSEYNKVSINSIQNKANQILDEYGNYFKYIFVLFLINLIIALVQSNKRNIIFLIALFLVLFSITFYIIYKGRIMQRVCMQLFMEQIFILFLMIIFNNKIKEKIEKICEAKKIISIIVIICCSIGIYKKIERIINLCGQEKYIKYEKRKYQYFEEHKDNFYIQDVNGNDSGEKYIYLLTNNSEKNFMEIGDWVALSPAFEQKIKNMGAENMRELYLMDNVYLVFWDDYELEELDFFGEDIYLEEVDKIVTGFRTYNVYKALVKE